MQYCCIKLDQKESSSSVFIWNNKPVKLHALHKLIICQLLFYGLIEVRALIFHALLKLPTHVSNHIAKSEYKKTLKLKQLFVVVGYYSYYKELTLSVTKRSASEYVLPKTIN